MTTLLKVRFTEGGGGCLSEVSLIGNPDFDEDNDTLELTDLFSHPSRRRGGGATRVIRRALAFADKRGFNLWLRVVSHGSRGLDKYELAAWYRKFGFVDVEEWRMYRKCSKKP